MEYKMNSVLIRSTFLLIFCFIVTCKSKPVHEDIFVSSYEGSVSFTQWIQKLEVSQKIDKKLILKCGEKHINILVIDSENDPSGFIFQKSTLSLIEEEEKNNIKNCKYRDYNPKIDDGKYVSSVVGVLNKSKLNSNQNEINFGDCSDTFLSALKTHSKKKCFRVVYSPPSSFLSRLYYTFIA